MKKQNEKAETAAKAKEVPAPEVQRMAYQGYCIAVGFDRSLVKAEAMLKAARAKDKDGLHRWHLYLITPNREHARGTKQAKLAAQK